MKIQYEILKAENADAPEILKLQYAAYQSEADIYNDYSIQPLTQTLEEAMEEFKENTVLKMVLDGKIIGSVRACEKDNVVYIGKLMVHPCYQNQGIGKQLLKAIEDEFYGKRYWLITGSKSEKNLSFYEKHGYIRYQTEEAKPGLTLVYLEKYPICVTEIIPADYQMLEDFLYHAIFIPPGANPLPREVIFEPDIYIYAEGFGERDGDYGVAAKQNAQIVGAAWVRIIPAFGHVDDDTPELAISVLPEYRGQGIGTMMMTRLFKLLRENGYKQTSLSVQKKNAAVSIYQRLGYKIVRENEEDYIMIKQLDV